MNFSEHTRQLIQAACEEDLGHAGDLTSQLLGIRPKPVEGRLVARRQGVICGLALLPELCRTFGDRLDAELQFVPTTRGGGAVDDGTFIEKHTCVGMLRGPQPAVLALERTALNFLSRLSAIATRTEAYVMLARDANPAVQILDTRKTIPGWRELDKYAVRCGGGTNHRIGLFDAVLIKDNHLAGVPLNELAAFLTLILKDRPAEAKFVEVEVDSLAQLEAVLEVAGIDYILLDNFSLDDMRRAVALRDERGLRGKLALEASGNINLETLAKVAATGVDRISAGALTHSAGNFDIGLDF